MDYVKEFKRLQEDPEFIKITMTLMFLEEVCTEMKYQKKNKRAMRKALGWEQSTMAASV